MIERIEGLRWRERSRPRSAHHAVAAWCFVLAAQALGGSTPAAAQDAVEHELRARVEQLRGSGRHEAAGVRLVRAEAVAAFYETRGLESPWARPGAAAALVRAVEGVAADGLRPEHYHLAALRAAERPAPDDATAAARDLLRTDALLALAHDLRHGRGAELVPAGIRSSGGPPSPAVLAALGSELFDAPDLAGALAALRPDHAGYRALAGSLARLRRVEAEGGWVIVPGGAALREGGRGPRVAALRRRLASEEHGVATAAESDSVFDPALTAAVQRFQTRHALTADGVVGPATLAALNVPVRARIDQVRVNLERLRWIARDLPDEYVSVNAAGAMVELIRDGRAVFRTRVIVGRAATPTPQFRATLRTVDLSPTWTVPPGIVHEVLDEIRRDPGYLRRMNMQVLDRGGRPVDVPAARLAGMSPGRFPYVFRQAPGPLNPLGEIKLMFPNPYNVYLHDTPARALFARDDRTFSHGCIRVEHPFRLAALALDEPERWDESALRAAAAEGRTRTLTLARPIPVIVFYWTAEADLGGELRFFRDPYRRDAAVLDALERR